MRRLSSASSVWIGLLILLFAPSIQSQGPSHPGILIRGFDGALVSIESKVPYSPKKTCGSCHAYDRITRGYHFQQGRTDGSGNIVIRDTFDPKFPWSLSSGLFGKFSPASMDASQLAKSVNVSPSEIDKSSFYYVENCGPCHPGGGWAEYDRRGNLYYNEETKKFGSEVSERSSLLDGDYTPFSMGEASYGSPWDRSGVSEADCLLCHLKGYQWQERAAALKQRGFKDAPTIGAGWGSVKTTRDESGASKGSEIILDYSQRKVGDFDRLHLQIVRKPEDENCWFCHAAACGNTKGRQWTPETDVHKARGLSCVTCHPGDEEHNLAKGQSIQQTVRDDLDNTMNSCEDCHFKGKDRRAPRYRHPFSPRHMKRIACQTCHIPFETAPADLVYDLASTGSAIIYDTPKFLSNDPLEPKKPETTKPSALWYPQMRDFKGRIVPVKSLVVLYWGDMDEKTQEVKPIALWKIRAMKRPALKDDDGDGISEVNSFEEIRAFLRALKANDSFGNPIAKQPVLIKGGFLYRLDKKGEVEKVRHEQAQSIDFSLSHNVVSGAAVIGARGCKDCHSKNSPFFLRKILLDPFDEKGRPVYVESWERLGFDREKLDRLLTVE